MSKKKIEKYIDLALDIFMWMVAIFYMVVSLLNKDIASIFLAIFLIVFEIKTSIIVERLYKSFKER